MTTWDYLRFYAEIYGPSVVDWFAGHTTTIAFMIALTGYLGIHHWKQKGKF